MGRKVFDTHPRLGGAQGAAAQAARGRGAAVLGQVTKGGLQRVGQGVGHAVALMPEVRAGVDGELAGWVGAG